MRRIHRVFLLGFLLWVGLTVLAGFMLPDQLLKGPMPNRTEVQRERIRGLLAGNGSRWTSHDVTGGEGAPLEVWWLHRVHSKGVAIILHGFGDDAWGSATRAQDLPDWDTVVFTFRGRDRHPEMPSTLGAWERQDVVRVEEFLESQGVPRSQILIVGMSMGAGVALLALADIERTGRPLAGALLESPYRDLRDAASNHLKGTLHVFEMLVRPAERIAIFRAAGIAHFNPDDVSPLTASAGLRTPIALLTGNLDTITPIEGVREIAIHHTDLTVVQGAGHCEAGGRVQGGWKAWADARLSRWGWELSTL
jgi:pimeloyl-ACP methyl ester carboxylesterase